MKKLVLLFIVCFCCSAFALDKIEGSTPPQISMNFTTTPPLTVFLGDTLIIPFQMNYFALRYNAPWNIPAGSSLQAVSGKCPPISGFVGEIWSGTCNMNLVIPGDRVGKIISGQLAYTVFKSRTGRGWNTPFYSAGFYITVIPHNLSMAPIPNLEATANVPFNYNLKPYVLYYDNNRDAGIPAEGLFTAKEQAGLSFDQASFSIVGTPNRIGTYAFKMGVKNAKGTAAAVDFTIHVKENGKDKPVFKQHHAMATALPEQKYIMNLMELIEPQAGFGTTNQVSFKFAQNQNIPNWLSISQDDATRLVAEIPPNLAGQEVAVTLIASSNTGGDSLPLTVKIPVAYDPAKKPIFNIFGLEVSAGSKIYMDLSNYINDPGHDSSLKVLLEKVDPAAPWLNISSVNQTVLEGTVPDEAAGQKYKLTLRASTEIGGSSESIIVPLQISVDKEQKPHFKEANPMMPMVYPGQPFAYDFVQNKDIYPEYNDAPYEIKFAEDFTPPTWLRIENDKLISDLVPENIDEDFIIKIIIKNIPGGSSDVYPLSLTVMN